MRAGRSTCNTLKTCLSQSSSFCGQWTPDLTSDCVELCTIREGGSKVLRSMLLEAIWLWVKNKYPFWEPWYMEPKTQNLRFPGGLILSHTHVGLTGDLPEAGTLPGTA